MTRFTRLAIAAGLLSFVIYPLSFAPLDRLINGGDTLPATSQDCLFLLLFRPVAFLENEDIPGLSRLLFEWAEFWNVGRAHVLRAMYASQEEELDADLDSDGLIVDRPPRAVPMRSISSPVE